MTPPSAPWKHVEHIGDCRLYLGDCLKVLPAIDLVGAVLLTDPPYGMGYTSGHNSSRKGAGAKMARKDGNFHPISGDQEPFDPSMVLGLGLPSIIWGANHFNDSLLAGKRWLVWDKLAGKTPLPSGSDVELAWCSQPGPDRIFTHLWRGIMRAGEENIVHSAKQHPNQKPVALMLWCLGFLPDGTVLDPFMGSGTTGVAAVRAGRPFIGIEMDEAHFETACRRVREAADQPSIFTAAQAAPEQLSILDGAA